MSIKQGQGERLYVLRCNIDGESDEINGVSNFLYTEYEKNRHLRHINKDAVFWPVADPQTERVVPKDAGVWTFEQLEDLLIRAEKDPENKLSVRDLIAKARGKGE